MLNIQKVSPIKLDDNDTLSKHEKIKFAILLQESFVKSLIPFLCLSPAAIAVKEKKKNEKCT